ATFDQLIDHNDPALGTFSQRYWWSTQFYGPPGSPVILFTPGEEPALDDYGRSYYLGYTADNTLTGQYAKAVGGAGIVLEHRYWGNSTPVSNLTVDNLRFLTIDQAIQDMVYFANNVKLPFDHNGSANADKCPWVLVGGSYSGALTAWTAVTSPGTFWAYHASSAPVQANQNLWTYFKPIQEGMPANCSKDMQLIIEFVDKILFNGTQAEVLALKTLFSLQTVEHNADFASLLIQGLWLFQSGFPSFYPFCDAIEGVNANSTLIPDENGVGLEAAILNFGAWMQPAGKPQLSIAASCGNISDCYDTYNGFGYNNPTYNPNALAGRAWWWLQCNEPLGYWQTGAPIGQTTLVSRLITSYYWQRQCLEYFPGANFSTNEDPFNAKYAGWNIANTTRLMFSNGEFDPWRSASVSSEFRPGGPLISTPEMPIIQVPRGIHCQDLYMENVTPEILETMGKEVQQMKFWVDQYY
ncbi:putative serine peptidase, partial [Hyaloscypha hepaticicola]